jgi:DNA-binding transcriptional ArsR family regulator
MGTNGPAVILFALLLCLPGFMVVPPTEDMSNGTINGTTNSSTAAVTTNVSTTTPESTVNQSTANAPNITATTDMGSDAVTTDEDANNSDKAYTTTIPNTTPDINGATDTNIAADTTSVADTTDATDDTVESTANAGNVEDTSDTVVSVTASTGDSLEEATNDSATTNPVDSTSDDIKEVNDTIAENVSDTADDVEANANTAINNASNATGGGEDNLTNTSTPVTNADEDVTVTVKETAAESRSFKPVGTPSSAMAQNKEVETNIAPNKTTRLDDAGVSNDANADGTVVTMDANNPGTRSSGTVPKIPSQPTKTAELAGMIAAAGVVSHLPEIATVATHSGSVGVFSATKSESRFWWLFTPLRYSKYDDSSPLEQEVRAELYERIERTPGTYLSQLDDQMDVSMSAIRHHLRILEDERMVTNAKIRGKRRFYPASDDEVELTAALAEKATADVLDAVSRQEPVAVGELADELDREPSTITYHLKRLEEDGLIKRKRNGRTVNSSLTSKAQAAFSRQPGTNVDD